MGRTVFPLFVMSSTDEDKISFSGPERIKKKKMDLVLLAREEESKVIDAVPRTQPILYNRLHVD